MSERNIDHTFIENACEIKVPIIKKGQNVYNLDLFISTYVFVLVSDDDIHKFLCPRQFNLEEMKNISVSFNSEQWEYTCILPCHPNEPNEKEIPENVEPLIHHSEFISITDSCVLSVDGKICEIQADFPYGFDGIYRGKPKYTEDDMSKICRVTDPSRVSAFKRTMLRENDEMKDFSPEQYKLNFAELQIPEGHENPMIYEIPYDDVNLTEEEECILEKIRNQHAIPIDVKTTRNKIDYGLVSILLGIMYDIRVTSNDQTCESHWTRTILSPVLSYFEQFENIHFAVESFLRRSLIYPLYRNFDLAQLCMYDVVKGMEKGKSWILKQLLVTYKCFCEADANRKALNKYFIRHYIWYVDTEMNNDYIQKLSYEIPQYIPPDNDLILGLKKIQMELLTEIMVDLTQDLQRIVETNNEGSDTESDSEYGGDSDYSD